MAEETRAEESMTLSEYLRLNADKADTDPEGLWHVCVERATEASFRGLYEINIEVRNTAVVCRVIERLEERGGVKVSRKYKGGLTVLTLSWKKETNG